MLAFCHSMAFSADLGMARTALLPGMGESDTNPAPAGLALASVQPSAVSMPAPGAGLPQQTQLPDAGPVASPPQVLPLADYQANQVSEVFGAGMFNGAFARAGSIAFNPDYVIANGDQVRVRMWGGFDFDAVLPVDEQGNIFLPHVGPMRVRGIRNGELQSMVTAALRKSYSARVEIYASLVAAQPVRVYVTGFVRRPGIYEGNSNDSLLRFIDLAGGIDPDRGSFLQVEVQRGGVARQVVSLYDFLPGGKMAQLVMGSGDVILVKPRGGTVLVKGLAANAKRFEFAGTQTTLSAIATEARPDASATHARVTRNSGTVRNVDYFPLAAGADVSLGAGDEVEFTADKRPGTITVRVEGEHEGPQEYVVPYGTRLAELMSNVRMTERSDAADLQLFRVSVQERQKAMLAASLRNLQNAVLTARSGSKDEAELRKSESEMILQWVERAKTVQPTGQTVLAGAANQGSLLLENGDILRVPVKDSLVLVSGQVAFPNAVMHVEGKRADHYIAQAGGIVQNEDATTIVVAHMDGTFSRGSDSQPVRPGDQILVLSRVDFKATQFAKDIFGVMYQIAIMARVALGL